MAKAHHTLTAIAARALSRLEEPVLPTHDRQWKFFSREKTRTDDWFGAFANFVEQRGNGQVKMLGFAPRLLNEPGRYFVVQKSFVAIEGKDEDGEPKKVRKTSSIVGIYAPAPDKRAFRVLGTADEVSGTTFELKRPAGKAKTARKPMVSAQATPAAKPETNVKSEAKAKAKPKTEGKPKNAAETKKGFGSRVAGAFRRFTGRGRSGNNG